MLSDTERVLMSTLHGSGMGNLEAKPRSIQTLYAGSQVLTSEAVGVVTHETGRAQKRLNLTLEDPNMTSAGAGNS